MTGSFAMLGLVALGGALGGMARYGLSELVARWLGDRFPWGTLSVNLSGALAIGVLAALLLPEGGVPAPNAETGSSTLWAVLVVGGLGSYTTLSSFSLRTLALLQAGQMVRAGLNVLGSAGGCLAAAAAGHLLVLALVAGP